MSKYNVSIPNSEHTLNYAPISHYASYPSSSTITFYPPSAAVSSSSHSTNDYFYYHSNLDVSSHEANKENTHETNTATTVSVAPTSANTSLLPAYFTTQKIAQTAAAKLSYTVYQLELLNAIYTDMKYPNSVQKTLIGKLIGITRDQVKIWFQNRRRKDTLLSQGKLPVSAVKSGGLKRRKSTDDFESFSTADTSSSDDQDSSQQQQQGQQRVVDTHVIDQVLLQLRAHQNAPSRLSAKRTKLCSDDEVSEPAAKSRKKADNVMQCQSTVSNTSVSPLAVAITHATFSASSSSNNSSSLLMPASSSSSSSVANSSSSCLSSLSSSSSEEEAIYTPNQTIFRPHHQKFQTLPQQSFSVKDYAARQSYLAEAPKVNNWSGVTAEQAYSGYVPTVCTYESAPTNYQPYSEQTSNGSALRQASSVYYNSYPQQFNAFSNSNVNSQMFNYQSNQYDLSAYNYGV